MLKQFYLLILSITLILLGCKQANASNTLISNVKKSKEAVENVKLSDRIVLNSNFHQLRKIISNDRAYQTKVITNHKPFWSEYDRLPNNSKLDSMSNDGENLSILADSNPE